jgi:hypothetical protein
MDDKLIVEYRNPAGSFEFQLREGPGFLRIKNRGVMTEADARHTAEALEEAGRRLGHPFPLLLDASGLESVEPRARSIMHQRAVGPDGPCSRIAFVGGSFAMGTLLNMYSRVAHKPMRHFEKLEEAEAWLKQ